MLGPAKSRDLGRPVPHGHCSRHLEARLDLGFVREWVSDAYPGRGRPSIDPVVCFKLSLVMVFEGIRSERQLLALAADRLSVRWYLGYGLDEALPDAAGFTRLRQRLGLAVFRRFFERVVDLCQGAGLVWGKEFLADATRVPGNASVDSLVPRLSEVVDDHLVALFGGDAAPDGADEVTRDGPRRWDLLEECRLDPSRPSSGPYRRRSDRTVSRTDPAAAAMSLRDGRTVLGDQDHDRVDGGKARIILHCLVTPGDVAENQVLLDQLRRTLFRRKLRPERVVADAKGRDRREHPGLGGAGHPRRPAVARMGQVLALLAQRRLRRRRRARRLPLPAGAGAQAGVDRRSRGAGDLPGARRRLQRLPGEGRMHAEQAGTPGQPLLPRRGARPRPRRPGDGGRREGAQEAERLGRAAVRRGQAVARLGAVPAAGLGQRHHRGAAGGDGAEPEALAPSDRLGTPGPAGMASAMPAAAPAAS